MKTEIWEHLSQLKTNGFFITAEIVSEDSYFPSSLDKYIFQKLEAIHTRKISARRFLYKENKWKIYLTYFPTNEVVDEKYALKNKFIRIKQ